eukprot:1158760_1
MALFLIVVMLHMSMLRCIIGCSVELWDLCSFSGTKWNLPSTGLYSQGNPFDNDAISSWKISSVTGKQCCVSFWYHAPERPYSRDLTQCAVNGGSKEVTCATSVSLDNVITTITVTQDTAPPTKHPTTKTPTDKPTKKPTKKPTNKPTKLPTQSPSAPPTGLPTEAPSFEPTKTQYPSQFPTLSPSNKPSLPPTKARVREAEVADDTTASPKRDVEDDSMETDKNKNEIILNMSKEIVIITLILFICSCLVCLCLLYKNFRIKRKAQDAIDALERIETNAHAGESHANTQDPPHVHAKEGPHTAIRLQSVSDVVADVNQVPRDRRDSEASEDSLYDKDAEQPTAQTPYASNSTVPRVHTPDPFPMTRQDSDESEDSSLHLYDKNAKQTATQASDCSKRACNDCGLMKEGKVFQDDGMFYCNQCWQSYA